MHRAERERVSDAASAAPTRFAYIDALRGYAILGVIAVHASQHVVNLTSPFRQIASSGGYGVQLFFVVSALTLMLSWSAREDGIGPFYIRRLFRIAPMFWLAIPLYLVIYGFQPRYFAPAGISWGDILATTFFLNGWNPKSITSVVPGGWSIAVETTFYALFPALVFCIRSLSAALFALVATTGCTYIFNWIARICVEAWTPNQPDYLISSFTYFWFWNQLPVFIVGFVVFFALREVHVPRRLIALGLVLSVTTMVLLAFGEIGGPHHVQYAASFGILTFCLANGVGGAIVNGPIRQLGKISFSAYLWHFAVFELLYGAPKLITYLGLEDRLGGWQYYLALLVGVTMITAGVAAVTYKFIERPMIAFGNRIARLSWPQPGTGLSR